MNKLDGMKYQLDLTPAIQALVKDIQETHGELPMDLEVYLEAGDTLTLNVIFRPIPPDPKDIM